MVGPAAEVVDGAAAVNEAEAALLAGGASWNGHPVASLENGQVRAGARLLATDLVLAMASIRTSCLISNAEHPAMLAANEMAPSWNSQRVRKWRIMTML